MSLDDLKRIDNLKKVSFEKCECFLHENHRWVLPIIHYAQERGTLPKPCTLVMFDAHHDAKRPSCIEEICRIRKAGITIKNLICLCKDKLCRHDGDWVKAAMELGLIDDAVIFGVEDRWSSNRLKSFKDHRGDRHRVELLGLPRLELEPQGSLSDIAQEGFYELWNILDWQCISNEGFTFAKCAKKILLDFDLDCFVINWRDYLFPWPDEVFEKEFFTPSTHWSTEGWTGKKLLDELVSRAALLTIARESKSCGNGEKADQILGKVNHFLFDDKLSF